MKTLNQQKSTRRRSRSRQGSAISRPRAKGPSLQVVEAEPEDVDLDVLHAPRSKIFEKIIRIRPTIPYSLEGRPYFKEIIECKAEEHVLKCGRQVGKSSVITCRITTYNGDWKTAGDVVLGDCLAALGHDGAHVTSGLVTWVSARYIKDCVRVRTRQGHILDVAKTHPIRQWERWTTAGDLLVGDRVAVVRRIPNAFTGSVDQPKERIRLTAYLLGDGSLTRQTISFTSLPGKKLDEFMADVEQTGATCRRRRTRSKADEVHVHYSRSKLVYDWLQADGYRFSKPNEKNQYGLKSDDKFIPTWVFDLNKEDTALFLNRLWSTDGSVKLRKSHYEISYCSISQRMIKEVQSLLWKFGVPSSIRKRWPACHKNRGVEKYAYELRVETQDGLRIFLQDIGAFTKSEGLPLPAVDPNNNRDTYPIEINDQIREIINSRGDDGRFGCHAETGVSLRTAGLRETVKYPLTKQKLAQYVEFFKSDYRYDQFAAAKLAQHLDTDLYWDEIVQIDNIGDQECVDFTVEDVHNFIVEGVVTHNSVLLSADSATEGARIPDLGQLYVAPRGEQAATFSRMVFDVMCRTSPYLSWLVPKGLLAVWQIGTRMMTNGSYFYFRSTFNSPDAIRGLTAYRIKFDEFQDVPSDHIGPIEEVAGNAPQELKQIHRAGTPKTFDNPLEKYWGQSSQCEWHIKCPGCGFYNFQDEGLLRPDKYACHKCDATLNPAEGVWVPGKPALLGQRNGWRITQLMNPNKTPQELWHKMHNYPMAQFMNEVLGLSYAEGQLLLSQSDVQRACNPRRKMAGVGALHDFPLTAGIDWGTGGMGAVVTKGSSRVSYTTLTIGGIRAGQYHVVYQKKFTGADADLSRQPAIINQLLTAFKVRVVFSDWGFGAPLNAILMNQFGWMYKNLFQVQEGAQKDMIRWSKDSNRYTIDRNEMFIKVIDDIKHGRIEFFNYAEFQEFEEDFTSIYVELDANKRRMKFDHTKPDDCFHSTSYGYFAALKLVGALSRFDMTSLLP